MTDGDRTSVAEREARAALAIANEIQRIDLRLKRVSIIASAARKIARRNTDMLLALGAPRSAVLPIWIIAGLMAALVGEYAALLLR